MGALHLSSPGIVLRHFLRWEMALCRCADSAGMLLMNSRGMLLTTDSVLLFKPEMSQIARLCCLIQ